MKATLLYSWRTSRYFAATSASVSSELQIRVSLAYLGLDPAFPKLFRVCEVDLGLEATWSATRYNIYSLTYTRTQARELDAEVINHLRTGVRALRLAIRLVIPGAIVASEIARGYCRYRHRASWRGCIGRRCRGRGKG